MTCGPFTMLFLFELPSITSSPTADVDEPKLTLLLESPSGPLVLVDSSLHGTKKEQGQHFLSPGSCKLASPLGLWRGWLRRRKHLFVDSLEVLDKDSNIVEQLFGIRTWSLTKLFLQ